MKTRDAADLQGWRDPRPQACGLEPGVESDGQTLENWTDLLLLSARSPDALERTAAVYADVLGETEPSQWLNIRATLAWSRPQHTYRLVVAAPTPRVAAERLAQHLMGEKTTCLARGKAPAHPPRLALVYSGNGPQWWGMGRELFAQSRIFREVIEEIDALFAPKAGWSLTEEMGRPESDSRIGQTEIAQPLLFAQQVALTAALSAAGVSASAVIGHSVGEVAAAWAAGALTLEQATDVIFHRSQTQIPTAGRGRMAALGIGFLEATQTIAGLDGWLEIAAVNSARAVTVAGPLDALEVLRDRMTADGKFVRILPLNYPFHTRAMDVIKEPLLLRLDGLTPSGGHIPFLSTVTGAEINGAELGGEYWWRNVRAPVQFEATVAHALQDHNIGMFLEVGPHPVLKDYLQQIVKAVGGASATVLSTLRRPAPGRPAPELEMLTTAVCSVYAGGGGEPKALFDKPVKPAKLPALTVRKTPGAPAMAEPG